MKDTNIFYNLSNLSFEEKISLLKDCKEISYHYLPNILDCSKSTSRQYIDLTFEEMIEKADDDTHFVCIDRGTWGDFDNIEHFEIGFRTMTGIDYFLFLKVKHEKMNPILEKYKLKPMKG